MMAGIRIDGADRVKGFVALCETTRPCSLELLISYGIIFFSHNKTTPVGLSAVKTISRTGSG
jgi:hypothetical protein